MATFAVHCGDFEYATPMAGWTQRAPRAELSASCAAVKLTAKKITYHGDCRYAGFFG